MAEAAEPSKDVRLSPYERLALSRIEAELRADRPFARRMGTGRGRIWLRLAVALLTAASLFLAVMGIRTPDPVVLWCFAVVWPLTLIQGVRLLCRESRPGRRA
ncbi:DUF3040 domain-containing protein [Streptomyces sp. NPDC005917]|uniref:DUF3040 domain-containing protein n=1 Tax=unclassified Streptomyces TaxID=2593676 RepID=UPI0033F30AC9